MIVVASSTSAVPPTKASHRLLELPLVHLAVGDDDARLGDDLAQQRRAMAPIDATRLCTKKTWPPRAQLGDGSPRAPPRGGTAARASGPPDGRAAASR